MARYIDADLIDLTKYKIGRSLATDWIDIEDVKRAIALTPTADVVPKSEVERLEKEVESKQFRCDSCDRIGLTHSEHIFCIRQARAESVNEILDKVDNILWNYKRSGTPINLDNIHKDIAELKKKYTGGNADGL